MKKPLRTSTVIVGFALGIVAGALLSTPSAAIADGDASVTIVEGGDGGGETNMMPLPGGGCVRCVAYRSGSHESPLPIACCSSRRRRGGDPRLLRDCDGARDGSDRAISALDLGGYDTVAASQDDDAERSAAFAARIRA